MADEVSALPEPERNRLLRRVDWRFLTGDGALGRVACFAPAGDPLHDALRHAGADVVAADVALTESCDLVVLVDPRAADLAHAVPLLRPGGACYVEYRARRRGWLPRARRALRRAGLADVRGWFTWPAPWRDGTTHWVPLEWAGPAGWYLAGRPRSRVRRYRLQAALQHHVWRLARRIGYGWPLVVVARRPGQGGAAPAARRLLLTSGDRAINKPIAFEFAPGQREPDLVLKYARVPESEPDLRHEAAILAVLDSRFPSLRSAVPSVRAVHQLERGTVVAQTVARGDPMVNWLTGRSFPTFAEQGRDWLIALAANGRIEPREVWFGRLVEPLLAEFHQRFAAIIDPGLMERTRSMVSALPALPLVVEHRDFWIGNLMRRRDGMISVIDWEWSDPEGLPLRDLMHYLVSLVVAVHQPASLAEVRSLYRQVIDPESHDGQVVNACVTSYAQALDLPIAAIVPLRVLTWLPHACDDHAQITSRGGDGSVSVDELRKSTFFALWEEEMLAQTSARFGDATTQ